MYLTEQFVEMDLIRAGLLAISRVHCHAGGVNSSSFEFRLGEIPKVIVHPADDTVVEKESTLFSCEYRPTRPLIHTFTWKFTDKHGTVTTLDRNDVPGDMQSGLSISPAMRSDAGAYACILENEFSKDVSRPATLTVQYFGDVELIVKPHTTVREKSVLTVECHVDAVPAATEIRLGRGDGLFYSLSDSHHNRLVTVLAVSNNVSFSVKVSPDWTGLLTCFAMNSLGNGSMAVNVTVQTPPDPPIVGDVVSSTHSVAYHWTLGDDGHSVITQVKISCHILGSMTVMDGMAHSVVSPSIIIGLVPGESYNCKLSARNAIGWSEASDAFQVETIAAAPAKPVLRSKPVSKTKTSLEIHWSVDYTGGYDIYQYTLRYRTTGTRSAWNQRVLEVEFALNRVINQQEGRWNLTGLERSTQYDVEVMAWNRIGSNTSDVSVYTTQKCAPAVASQVRTNNEADATYKSIQLVFTLPSDNDCGAITKYLVRDVDGGNTLTSSHAVIGNVVTITITDLEPQREYEVRVYVQNEYEVESVGSDRVSFVTSPNSEPLTSNDGGLTGTMIGIIVGAGSALLIVFITLCVCFRHGSRRRRRRRHKLAGHEQQGDMQANNERSHQGVYHEIDVQVHIPPVPSPNVRRMYSPRRKECVQSDSEEDRKAIDSSEDEDEDSGVAVKLRELPSNERRAMTRSEVLQGCIEELDEEIKKLRFNISDDEATPDDSDVKQPAAAAVKGDVESNQSDADSVELSTFV
ncbi:cell adhesion molecule DSCAML1-like isoform X2 [Corticium candelabrum]|nr:cell adhesion molecule DSCAML1-like isoform X2 [Corticium candelabrum]